ncbi:sodium:proton antiporter NhaD [Vibrio salinus]|uniref:sodium:proton antiporter NhaD n=1 Tax=Vibrio salinus TaxID=2899784 RepID=UPI001E2C45F5|nr:sodium:proton antiporter NhaD [Vibrio salinus]MCE0495112.1 sodium:proton antiporter NhaD [Vibrio salinus]
MVPKYYIFISLIICIFPNISYASDFSVNNMTSTWVGYSCVLIFIIAYAVVMMEEKISLRKSKPVLVSAGLIWALIGYSYHQMGLSESAKAALEHNLLEYAELLMFLLVAMTYINAMEERRLFDYLKSWMINKGFKFTTLYWFTGILSFCISPIADNLTTALLMCAVVMKVGEGNKKFITLSCINIVIAANAGGAFSPFGDITTLMVWQTGKVEFAQFFDLFIPCIINYFLPALIIAIFIPKDAPKLESKNIRMKRGAKRIVFLFLSTIITAVYFHIGFDFPPVLGMMLGLSYLQLFGFYLRRTLPKFVAKETELARIRNDMDRLKSLGSVVPFDVFKRISNAEWDTLLFFYGVVMSVGGLSLLGYLGLVSNLAYTQWDPLWANVSVGIISSIVDNIPVMYAVLTMDPIMSHGHWLLVTLTAGVGGSLLSIGSAAGVALMGASEGKYTFISHLKWTPVIFLGYVASVIAHLWLNSALFAM